VVPTSASHPYGVTAGPDGALWFTENGANKIGCLTTAGSSPSMTSPWRKAGPSALRWDRTAPCGSASFARDRPHHHRGRHQRVSDPTAGSAPIGIVTGPDGALWFAENGASKVGRITTDGVVTEYPLPTGHGAPISITVGPDGALWFTESDPTKHCIGRITTDGVITEYPLAAVYGAPTGITSGPDGAVWFTENGANLIGGSRRRVHR